MSYLIMFFVIVGVIGLLVFLIVSEENKKKAQSDRFIENQLVIENFSKENYHSPIPRNGNGIVLDTETKRLGIVALPDGIVSVYAISQIVSASVEHKYKVTQTTTREKGVNVGRAVVGGLAFGGVGAIIGGVTGKSKEVTVSNDTYEESIITLHTNQVQNPIIKINLSTKSRAEKVIAQINLLMGN